MEGFRNIFRLVISSLLICCCFLNNANKSFADSTVNLKNETQEDSTRRSRLHEILIALIKQQKDLELIDDGVQFFENPINNSEKYDPSKIVERNQRIIKKYQSLVRSAIALDALLESEDYDIGV